MLVKIKDCEPKKMDALGATLSELHMAPLHLAVEKRDIPEGTVVILDFTGIKAINASYVKSSFFWLFLCGQLAANRKAYDYPVRRASDPRPCDIYVVAAGLEKEVEEEFVEFFKTRQLPLLIAKEWSDENVHSAILEGHLEPALKTTLTALLQRHGGNAPQLHSEHPGENITVTAWNNRLSDLSELRLVRRTRVGKMWNYQPIAERITYGRSIY